MLDQSTYRPIYRSQRLAGSTNYCYALLVAILLVESTVSARADTDCAESVAFTIDNRLGSGILSGLVVRLNAQGQSQGPLVGATVTVPAVGSASTNSQGEFLLGNVPEGTYTVTASKTGYFSVSRSVTLRAGETKHDAFSLTVQSSSGTPVASGFSSPNGKHFIEGMPGNLIFSTDVAWNGSPGSARFKVADTWCPATIQDLGGGTARATLTVVAPETIAAISEWEIQVTNGEALRTTVRPGVYFYPVPPRVRDWYQGTLAWIVAEDRLGTSRELAVTLWKWEIPSGVLTTEAKYSDSLGLWFDANAGRFIAERGVKGGFDFTLQLADVELLGGGRVEGTGVLQVNLRGFSSPTIEGSVAIDITGRAGLGAPVILVVDAVFPPLAPFMATLRATPIVGDVLKIARLRLFLIGGLGVEGHWTPEDKDCWLGATSWNASGTLGLEGQALLAAWGAEVGVYAGGTGMPTVQFCPELQFQGITLRGYVGVFAKAWLFRYSEEVGWETTLGGPETHSALAFYEQPGESAGQWRPIGAGPPEWGDMNRLATDSAVRRIALRLVQGSSGSEEQLILENVTSLASPSVSADQAGASILFVLHDPAKPWYSATDIAQMVQSGGGPWSLDRTTDDDVAEFSPRVVQVDAGTNLAAWERVSGDVSGATGPGDVVPHLEVVTSGFDGIWSTPIQVTSNAVVDRAPLPIVFGNKQGVLWIQNQAGASPGDAINGDRLMFAEWNGSGYQPAQTLWSEQKGILNLSFAADAAGQGHVVFVVDEDGVPETRPDRELYAVSTAGGVWQASGRLTNDAAEDAVPALIAVDGVPKCVWSAGGTVSYTALATWSPKAVYSEQTIANEAATLDGVAMPGGAAIAYTVQGPSGIDIVASFYDSALDKWSLPRQLTRDEHAETALALAFDGTSLVIAYLKTQTERNKVDVEINGVVYPIENVPQPARTDLYVLRHILGNDLAIAAKSVVVEPANPPPGSAVILKATVENHGDLAVQNAEVAFYDGDPNFGGVIIGSIQVIPDLLVGGASREVTVGWSIPLTGSSGQLYVIADPSLLLDDRDRSNNTVSAWAMLSDLMIETSSYNDVSEESVALTARVVNSGALASEASDVSWRLGTADGPEIGRTLIDALPAGGSYEAALLWSTLGFNPGEFVQVAAVVDSADLVHEWDETNNVLELAVRIPTVPVFSPADFDRDGAVDAYDYGVFEACILGPAAPHDGSETCLQADFDDDKVVDLLDFGILQRCYSGEGLPTDPNCDN